MKMVYHAHHGKSNLNNVYEVKKTRLDLFKSRFAKFCKRTDLHGFKYIVMEELNGYERGCWAIAVFASVICAGIFVVAAYRWYARNPIVTVIESTQGAIWDVPFPAVTICDLNVVSRKAALSLSKNLSLPENVTDEFVFNTLRYIPLLHSSSISSPEIKSDLRILQGILDHNNIPIQSLFKMLSPSISCNNLVQRCMWKNTVYRCDMLFQQIFSTVSLCCSFNYFAVAPDRKRQSGLILMPKPRRVASCGYQTALTVLVESNLDDYYSTKTVSNGVMVMIDNAYNVPDLDSTIRLMNPSTEVLMALSPEHTYTTPGIKTFKSEERECYYHNELKCVFIMFGLFITANCIQFAVMINKPKKRIKSESEGFNIQEIKDLRKIGDFLQYSFHNCKAYQRVQVINKYCNCVPFYSSLQNKVPSDDVHAREKIFKDTVQCLPECEHFEYPLEVALGNLAVNVPLNGLSFYQKMNLENRSILNVFFNDLVSTRYRRDVYLNWQNILASFGGLLSLMLGFTLVSGIDFCLFFVFKIFYDLTLRSCNNAQEWEENHKSTRGTILQVDEMHKKAKNNNDFNDFNKRALDEKSWRKY